MIPKAVQLLMDYFDYPSEADRDEWRVEAQKFLKSEADAKKVKETGEVRVVKFDATDDEVVNPMFVPEGAAFAAVTADFEIEAIHMRVIRNNAPPETFKKVEAKFPVEAGTFIEINLDPFRHGRTYFVSWLSE